MNSSTQPIGSFILPLIFTVRVYGILKDSNNRILVSDEYIKGSYFTKFPGGGLEFGEGTRGEGNKAGARRETWRLLPIQTEDDQDGHVA